MNDWDCEHGKSQGLSSSLSELPASKDIFVILTAYAGSLTNDLQYTRRLLDFETFLPDRSLQRSDRTSVGRFCDRHEVKPNRKFDSVRGLVDRNFRTVRPRFSIQFSISSPVIVRNHRIEPKFNLLNLSNLSLF